MRFVTFEQASDYLRGRTVAIVGSGPSCLDNEPGFIDSHQVVVRVNNYKTGERQGFRCDVHYSFYGGSIRKRAEDLLLDGVYLCWCKCPDSKPIDCDWHVRNNKMNGIDFRYIYRTRKNWWFCDTFVPTSVSFCEKFELLEKHIPTTGFSAILDVLACHPKSVYVTGFDFFSSGVHNVDEKWRPGNPQDPICHRPDLEACWLRNNGKSYPLTFDKKAQEMIA